MVVRPWGDRTLKMRLVAGEIVKVKGDDAEAD